MPAAVWEEGTMRVLRYLLVCAVLGALSLACVSTVSAGVVFDLETTYYAGPAPAVESGQVFVLAPNMKVKIVSGPSKGKMPGEMVYRGDKRQMIVVDHGEKAYMIMDRDTFEKVAAQMPGGEDGGAKMQEAMKELEKQMEDLGPEERKMMEKILKDKMPPGAALGGKSAKPEYRKTKDKEDMGGYPCVRYDVYSGEEKTQELWVTDWKNIEGSAELKAVFEDMAVFYAEMMKSLDQIAGGMIGAERNPMEDFANIDGFPVVSRTFEGGELTSETTLKSVSEVDLNAGEFDAPEGYKLRKMGE
jgi:hypothetical protein